jgi:hypothetical protein
LSDRPLSLPQEMGFPVNRGDTGSAAGQFNGIESSVATDVERSPARQIGGELLGNGLPFAGWKVPKWMIRRRLAVVGKV